MFEAIGDWLKTTGHRISNPLLSTFILVFVTHEWEFLYALLRGNGNGKVAEAITTAAGYLTWYNLLIDVAVALLIFYFWPGINRRIRNFQASQDAETENTVKEAGDRRRRYTKEEWKAQPDFRLKAEQVHALVIKTQDLLSKLYGRGEVTSDKYVLATEISEPVEPGDMVKAVRPANGTLLWTVAPFSALTTPPNAPCLYVLDVLVTSAARLVVCAQDQANVPLPVNGRPGTIYASDVQGHVSSIPSNDPRMLEALEKGKCLILKPLTIDPGLLTVVAPPGSKIWERPA